MPKKKKRKKDPDALIELRTAGYNGLSGGGLATSNFYTFYGIQMWQIAQNLLIHLVLRSTYAHLLIKLTFNIPKKSYLRNIIILITCINKCINITLSMCGILYHYHYRH